MQTSNLECICGEGMRATCSSNETSILPTAVALLLAWLGYLRFFAGNDMRGLCGRTAGALEQLLVKNNDHFIKICDNIGVC
jgi:hypothetical protein